MNTVLRDRNQIHTHTMTISLTNYLGPGMSHCTMRGDRCMWRVLGLNSRKTGVKQAHVHLVKITTARKLARCAPICFYSIDWKKEIVGRELIKIVVY